MSSPPGTPPPPPSADAARARFAAATAAHLTAPLADGVTLRHVDHAELMAISEPLWDGDPRPRARLDATYTAEVSARLADLNVLMGDALVHRVVIEQDGAPIGAYWGQQESYGRYYMVSSIFAPAARGRGLYSALLPRIVDAVRDAGFQIVYSRHRADNNAILVPKLRAGFNIVGMEIDVRWGILVHLRRYLLDGLDRVYRFRCDGADAAGLVDDGVF